MDPLEELKNDIKVEKIKAKASRPRPQSRDSSPNRGSSLPDFKAIGPDSETKDAWRKARGIDKSKQVRIVKLAHMRYQHPDLHTATTFLKDFGMTVVKKTETQRWFRGYGPDQYVYYAQEGPMEFLGGTFEVESSEELEKITKLPGITVLDGGIHEMKDAPGGGLILTIKDPEGFKINFIYGQAPVTEERRQPEKIVLNDERDKPRQRAFQRFHPGPAEVHKLGHFGLNVENFENQMDWYTRHFNIIPSDILYVPMDKNDEAGNPMRKEVAIFAHIDRGDELVDHHTMFIATIAPGLTQHVHHSSYEVHDFDTQALGHQWLAQMGYKSVWGIGRHILGSQIFDYWWDTTGFMMEHYADGDLVNEDTPIGYSPAGFEGLAVWGPEVPKAFLN